jgi:Big-like domain-containing protein
MRACGCAIVAIAGGLVLTGTTACTHAPATTVAPATMTLLTIGPQVDTLIVGESRRLTAFAVYSDGGGSTVKASWRTDPPTVATIDGEGVLTAVEPGRAAVTAVLEGRTASFQVLVWPDFQSTWSTRASIVACESRDKPSCSFFPAGTLIVNVTLSQLADRVTGRLGTGVGGAIVHGVIGVDGALTLDGATESAEAGVTHVAFRIDSWKTTLNAGRLSGRAVFERAEYPYYLLDPTHPTNRVTVEFRDVPSVSPL